MTISVKLIKYSTSQEGVALPTFECRYPEFIHGEVMTHRVFSRNSSSTRAIPIARMIKDVMTDPAMPMHWGAAQKGMVADEECDNKIEIHTALTEYFGEGGVMLSREEAHLYGRDEMVKLANSYDKSGYHKQIANQYLRPWMHQTTVITGTEWQNYFTLRIAPDARPEIHELAVQMRKALELATPTTLKPGEWHLPYVEAEDWELIRKTYHEDTHLDIAKMISVARCARVSYKTHEGKRPTVHADVSLFYSLFSAPHLSPFEHQATPDYHSAEFECWRDGHLCGNFRPGWVQFRKVMEVLHSDPKRGAELIGRHVGDIIGRHRPSLPQGVDGAAPGDP